MRTMQKIFFTALIIIGLALAAKCQPPLFVAGKVVSPVACDADAAQTYAVYIPARGNGSGLPIIYMFDPHGDGTLPLNKYRQLADEYGFILVGSNNSKNGNDWPTTNKIWARLFADTQKKLKMNSNRIYTCGFSGGAKVAGYVAIEYAQVKGVIANSAALPDGIDAGDFNFSFTGIAGEGDMNMLPVLSFTNGLNNTTTRHRLILFDGKHEWAPAAAMNIAFTALEFDNMQRNPTQVNMAFVNRYTTQSRQRITELLKTNQFIKAKRECDITLSFLTGLPLADDIAWFTQQASSIAANNSYKSQLTQQQALLDKEQSLENACMQQFRQGDEAYWAKTITGLQKVATAKTLEGAMYQRVLAWLSLAFYSISNQLITTNDNAGAQHFVGLYKLADPRNTEAWYFSAILQARAGKTSGAQSDLQTAVSLGFNDKLRLTQQPEFKKLDLAVIKSKLK